MAGTSPGHASEHGKYHDPVVEFARGEPCPRHAFEFGAVFLEITERLPVRLKRRRQPADLSTCACLLYTSPSPRD